MTKRNITKTLVSGLKVAAIVAAVSQMEELTALLGEKAAWAGIAFAGASAAKDIIVTLLDAIDDGKINGSAEIFGATMAYFILVGVAALMFTGTFVSCSEYEVTGGLRGYGGEVEIGPDGQVHFWVDAEEMAKHIAPPAVIVPEK